MTDHIQTPQWDQLTENQCVLVRHLVADIADNDTGPLPQRITLTKFEAATAAKPRSCPHPLPAHIDIY